MQVLKLAIVPAILSREQLQELLHSLNPSAPTHERQAHEAALPSALPISPSASPSPSCSSTVDSNGYEDICLVILEVVNRTWYMFHLTHECINETTWCGTKTITSSIGPQTGRRYVLNGAMHHKHNIDQYSLAYLTFIDGGYSIIIPIQRYNIEPAAVAQVHFVYEIQEQFVKPDTDLTLAEQQVLKFDYCVRQELLRRASVRWQSVRCKTAISAAAAGSTNNSSSKAGAVVMLIRRWIHRTTKPLVG